MLTVIVYLFPAKPKALALIERAKAETPTIKISKSTGKFFSFFYREKATSTRQHILFV